MWGGLSLCLGGLFLGWSPSPPPAANAQHRSVCVFFVSGEGVLESGVQVLSGQKKQEQIREQGTRVTCQVGGVSVCEQVRGAGAESLR